MGNSLSTEFLLFFLSILNLYVGTWRNAGGMRLDFESKDRGFDLLD